jgi:two-component system, NtrC family, nitrogen regulation sensor histidine kinase GlnL
MIPKPAITWSAPSEEYGLDGELILNGLSSAILVINADQSILKLNTAAEQFLSSSATNIVGHPLSDFIPPDSPLFVLVEQVRLENQVVSEHDLTIETPRIGRHFVNVHAAPIAERPGVVILSIHSRSIAEKIDRQLSYRGAARSVTAMAAMLAHEVKNPLSGIRGAAQLLEDTVSEDDQSLARLIRDEVDRIVELVDRMGMFAGDAPIRHQSVNIHQILDRVLQVSKNGFGRHARFVTQFDPSLPPVRGNRDQLVQVFLNLIKNAVEAAPDEAAEIVMETSYQHGVRFAVPGNSERVHLPLTISITDNGTGIPDDMMPHLFDPFVTSKSQGSGLGLALVAKIIGDHGGIVECETANTRTVFRVMLPMFKDREGIE